MAVFQLSKATSTSEILSDVELWEVTRASRDRLADEGAAWLRAR